MLDSRSVRAYLPQERFQMILNLTKHKADPKTSVRACLGLLRHMALCICVIQFARLHLYFMQGWLKSVYLSHRNHMDKTVTVLHEVISLLSWWKDPIQVCRGVPLSAPLPTKTLIVETSTHEWGGWSHLDHLQTQGLCSPAEAPLHINIMELRTISLACKIFLPVVWAS